MLTFIPGKPQSGPTIDVTISIRSLLAEEPTFRMPAAALARCWSSNVYQECFDLNKLDADKKWIEGQVYALEVALGHEVGQ